MTNPSVAPRKPMSNDTSHSSDTKALATRTPHTTVITTPEEYDRALHGWQAQRAHILAPLAQLGAIPSSFSLVPTQVRLSADPKVGDVYVDKLFCSGDEVAIAKPGLAKLAQAAGASIKTERTDPRTIGNFWEVRATLRVVGFDGSVKECDNTAEYDLRDGSARVNKIKASAERNRRDPQPQIEAARQYGLRGCEARAINAVIRQVFSLRQKYNAVDLAKPFICVQVVYNPDLSNPIERQIVTERRLAGTSLLFGQGRQLPAAPEPELLDVIGAGATPAAHSPSAGDLAPDPPTPREVLEVRHDMEAGCYDIRLDGGEVVITRSSEAANQILAAKKAGRRITLELDDAGELKGFALVEGASSTPSTSEAGQDVQAGSVVTKVQRIDDVRSGKRTDGSTWGHRKIATDHGDWFTFDDKATASAEEAKAKGWPVRIKRAEENPKYPDQLDIDTLTLIDPRQGNMLDDPKGGL